jgi:hypothetical protein
MSKKGSLVVSIVSSFCFSASLFALIPANPWDYTENRAAFRDEDRQKMIEMFGHVPIGYEIAPGFQRIQDMQAQNMRFSAVRQQDYEERQAQEVLERASEKNVQPNYYKLLGISPDAKQDEIKKKYYAAFDPTILGMRSQPEYLDWQRARTRGAMLEAYATLFNRDARSRYDVLVKQRSG